MRAREKVKLNSVRSSVCRRKQLQTVQYKQQTRKPYRFINLKQETSITYKYNFHTINKYNKYNKCNFHNIFIELQAQCNIFRNSKSNKRASQPRVGGCKATSSQVKPSGHCSQKITRKVLGWLQCNHMIMSQVRLVSTQVTYM